MDLLERRDQLEGRSDGPPLDHALALRDLYLEVVAGQAEEGAEDRLKRAMEAIERHVELEVAGLELSFHPTARFRVVRFLDAEHLDERWRDLFARPVTEMPHMVAAFVDPEAFHFRTFENIVPLDRLMQGAALAFSLTDCAQPSPELDLFTFSIGASEDARRVLDRLDGLELYVPPLNAGSRGGKRYIFLSEQLSEALGEAVRQAMPEHLLGGFSHVNPVFRCNRFEPGDGDFLSHLDTPYYDAARDHVSRYTMILYLTGGEGASTLEVEGVALDAIEEMTCVVFDQRYEHGGRAFDEGRKVFLRTELIFEDASVEHDPGIAQLFSRACYMTGESIFCPELEAHAHDCYDRVAAAHWGGLSEPQEGQQQPWLRKSFGGVRFVANGYDFWFAKSGGLSLQQAAALSILDYFNCRIDGEPFRRACTSEVIEGSGDADWIASLLEDQPEARPGASPFGRLDPSLLCPEAERVDPRICCPFHIMDREFIEEYDLEEEMYGDGERVYWDATRNDDIVRFYEEARRFTSGLLARAPIFMMGQRIFLGEERFLVEGDKIYVSSEERCQPVNFAACWNAGGMPGDYIDVETSIEAPFLLLPPILFRETRGCYHLMLDFFRNSWMVRQREQRVPVPKIWPGVYDDYDGDNPGLGRHWIEEAEELGFEREGGTWW